MLRYNQGITVNEQNIQMFVCRFIAIFQKKKKKKINTMTAVHVDCVNFWLERHVEQDENTGVSCVNIWTLTYVMTLLTLT